jgi:hypothetical protein
MGRVLTPGRLVTATLGALLVVNLVRDAQAYIAPPSQWINDLAVGSSWLAANAPPGTVTMTRYAMEQHLYTKSLTVRYPNLRGATDEAVLQEVLASGAGYVLVSPLFWSRELDPQALRLEQLLASNTSAFSVAFESPDDNVRIYEVREKGRAGHTDSPEKPVPARPSGRL